MRDEIFDAAVSAEGLGHLLDYSVAPEGVIGGAG